MFFGDKMIVTDIEVYEVDFQKTEEVFVPGRPFHALSFRISGKVQIKTETENLISTAGSITYVPKGEDYHTRIYEKSKIIVVHFKLAEEIPGARAFVFKPEREIELYALFAALYKQKELHKYTVFSLFYELLAKLRQMSVSEQSSASLRMINAKEYIHKNLASGDLSVSAAARYVNISEVYFRKEFKKTFGVSPAAYIKNKRIESAKLLLKTGYYTIGTIAEKCGFESLSYFSYEFRRLVGVSPGEYAGLYEKTY